MKKLLALTLSFALILAMVTTAVAENDTTNLTVVFTGGEAANDAFTKLFEAWNAEHPTSR